MGGHKSDDTSIYFRTELLADASTYTDPAYEFVYYLEDQAQNCDTVPADLLLLRSQGEDITDAAKFSVEFMRPNSDRHLRPTGDVSLSDSGKICINKAWCDPATAGVSPAHLSYVDDTHIHSCVDDSTFVDSQGAHCHDYTAAMCDYRRWDVPG
jgi:hypothetical protein